MSDTPRTDAEPTYKTGIAQTRTVNIDFARQLERELAEAVAKERERCARVSEEYPGALHSRQEELMAYDIAAAIRKGE